MTKLDKFKQFLNEEKKAVLLDFYATWCKPCAQMAPAIDFIEETYKDAIVVKRINADDDYEIVMHYKIQSLPTIIIVRDNNVLATEMGYQSKNAIEELIRNTVLSN